MKIAKLVGGENNLKRRMKNCCGDFERINSEKMLSGDKLVFL